MKYKLLLFAPPPRQRLETIFKIAIVPLYLFKILVQLLDLLFNISSHGTKIGLVDFITPLASLSIS
jgi:hypothetical protein